MKGAWTVGVDFGGTNVKIGLVTSAARVHRTLVVASKDVATPTAFINRICDVVNSLARSVGIRASQLRGVGVGAPGPVDVTHGVVHSLVNVPGWRQVSLRRPLERRLKCPCLIDNDANLFTIGEWRAGAGRGARALVGLTLGTGVGGGLVCDGVLYRGASGSAGEAGHMVIDPHGWRCGCGRRGCLEAYVGTRAILRLAREAIRRHRAALWALAQRAQLTPELVSRAAEQGDASARTVWVAVGRSLGIGLANLVNVLNPDRIVIGGGVAQAWRWFAPTMRKTVRHEAMAISQRAVGIIRGRLGSEAGIIGAAVGVWQELRTARR